MDTSSQPSFNTVDVIQPCSIGTKVKPMKTWPKAHWAARAASIGSRIWKVISRVTMFQITNEGPHCKEPTTTQVLTSSLIMQLIALIIMCGFFAKPTPL